MIGFGLGGVIFGITGPILEELGLNSTREGIMVLGSMLVWMRVFIAMTAGITEEILLRTYPIERLKEWSGNIWLAALRAFVIFVLLHLPFWSLGGTIQIGLATLIWTLIYIKTRSLWTMIIMHCVNDLFAFVMLPNFFAS